MPFTEQDAIELKNRLKAEEVSVQLSTLGGMHNASLLVLVCLEPRNTWKNGILQNSKHARFHIGSRERKIELFSGGFRDLKFRKTKGETVTEIATKIQKWIDLAVNHEGVQKAF